VTRDLIRAGLLWLALTVVGEYLVVSVDLYPAAMSDKGEEIDHAFTVLMAMAVPVFSLVVAVVVYTILAHRVHGLPEQDGPPQMGRGTLPVAWLAITSGLTALVIVYPGLTSLGPVVGVEDDADLTVEVTGVQWTWLVSYPDEGVENVRELVLPVDREVKFEITSLDVLHSFWVPAFFMKIDAVPGRTTSFSLAPTEEGEYESNPMLRVQCTELCGLSHSRMQVPVRVVSEEEFASWVSEHGEDDPQASPDGVLTLDIAAKDLLFDVETLEAPAGEVFNIRLDNQDEGVLHNVSVYSDESADEVLFQGDIFAGLDAVTYKLPALDAQTYFFRCDVHPATMTGSLVVE